MTTDKITYYSTNLKSDQVSFSEALLKGLAPDGGLYMPSRIPALSAEEIERMPDQDYSEIATTVLGSLIGNEIGMEELTAICREAYDFDVPLEHLSNRRYILRLDQGPTASFKDFAARMMSRLMQYYTLQSKRQLTILTATSGDTGSAVANAFYGLKDINVIILFPSDEVSPMQRKQMTTLGKNITVLAIDGKFDDCQRIVKSAFTDPVLKHLPLSSANSINTGRLLPQSVYYFFAWAKLRRGSDDPVTFSVPSGNFGNLMGGLIAKSMGLPVNRFVISTNANKEVPDFLNKGIYAPITPSINCISSAMNVGHPSNLARIVALYGGIMNEQGVIEKQPDMERMKKDMSGISVSDDDTRTTIKEAYNRYGIILEPHGAVAWKGLEQYLEESNTNDDHLSVSIETAHPAKFPDEIRDITGKVPSLPDSLTGLADRAESYLEVGNSYEKVKDILMKI